MIKEKCDKKQRSQEREKGKKEEVGNTGSVER
jgi:hypothetical protein